MFALNTVLLVLTRQETCFCTAPCARADRAGYNFGSNTMTFQLPTILRHSTLGGAHFLIDKAVSQHQRSVSERGLQLYAESH